MKESRLEHAAQALSAHMEDLSKLKTVALLLTATAGVDNISAIKFGAKDYPNAVVITETTHEALMLNNEGIKAVAWKYIDVDKIKKAENSIIFTTEVVRIIIKQCMSLGEAAGGMVTQVARKGLLK